MIIGTLLGPQTDGLLAADGLSASVITETLRMASFGRNVVKLYSLQSWRGLTLRPRSGWSVMDSMFNMEATLMIKG